MERVPSCLGLSNRLVLAALKPPGAIFLDFFSWKILPYGDFTWLTPVDFTSLERDTRDVRGGGVLNRNCCPLKLTLCAKHEGETPLRQTFCKQTCLLTIGKGAFMSWLVKLTGVGSVKTSWYYFPGFFVLENFTLWRFYVADASRFY